MGSPLCIEFWRDCIPNMMMYLGIHCPISFQRTWVFILFPTTPKIKFNYWQIHTKHIISIIKFIVAIS